MTERPRFHLVDLVAHDYDATLAFYRRLGADVEDGPPGEIRHSHPLRRVDVHIDNEHLAGIYNASWRVGEQTRVVLGWLVPTRDDVDATNADLKGAGYDTRSAHMTPSGERGTRSSLIPTGNTSGS